MPYPPLFNEVNRNSGFVDLRGRPELVGALPEVCECPALQDLLTEIAAPNFPLMSLGCDLGRHIEPDKSAAKQHVSGGYIQLAGADLVGDESADLRTLAKQIDTGVRRRAGRNFWRFEFELQPVRYTFGQIIDAYSLWLWFFAIAATSEEADASRARLLGTLLEVITPAATGFNERQ